MSSDAIITRQVSGHITLQGTAEDHARWTAQEEALRSNIRALGERTKNSGHKTQKPGSTYYVLS